MDIEISLKKPFPQKTKLSKKNYHGTFYIVYCCYTVVLFFQLTGCSFAHYILNKTYLSRVETQTSQSPFLRARTKGELRYTANTLNTNQRTIFNTELESESSILIKGLFHQVL